MLLVVGRHGIKKGGVYERLYVRCCGVKVSSGMGGWVMLLSELLCGCCLVHVLGASLKYS